MIHDDPRSSSWEIAAETVQNHRGYLLDIYRFSKSHGFSLQVKSIPAHGGGISSLSWASASSPVVFATGRIFLKHGFRMV